MAKFLIDPLVSIVLFVSVVIFSFINKRGDLFIFINTILLFFIFISTDRKKVITFFFIYLFAILQITLVAIDISNGIGFEINRFKELFYRGTTLIFMLFLISNKVTYKSIINILNTIKVPATLLELISISIIGIQILARSASRLITSMKSRNLFSKPLIGVYSTGIFLGVMFRNIIYDTNTLSLVSNSRRIDRFYCIMVDDIKIQKWQLLVSIFFGTALILMGVFLNGK
ncbi:MAG: hypothetical protein LDL13_03955 [Calditerrivibrio sp.]|nr:hypothetical protein [Calditerrivibrio sp.]